MQPLSSPQACPGRRLCWSRGRSSPEHQHLDGDMGSPDGMKSQGGDDMGEEAGTKLGVGGCWETDKGRALGIGGEVLGDSGGLMSPNPSEEAGLMAGTRRCRH